MIIAKTTLITATKTTNKYSTKENAGIKEDIMVVTLIMLPTP